MKNFNKLTFLLSTVLFGLLLIPAFLTAWAADEGTLGTNIILVAFSKLFYVLRFPTHTLLGTFFSTGGFAVYIAGLIINCLFFGFMAERILAFIKYKR